MASPSNRASIFSKSNGEATTNLEKIQCEREPSVPPSLTTVLGGSSPTLMRIYIPTTGELNEARDYDNFRGTKVSDLFLKIYLNVLKAEVAGRAPVSSTKGAVSLTIISTVPDIADHYYNLIIEAKTEILIFSNFWKLSYASRRIGDAFKILSERIGKRGGPPVNVRIMFDRGSYKHVLYSRIPVYEAERVSLGLPSAKDIPNLKLEIINHHKFPLGTLHSKFMVVDKKLAVVNSCNIQDNSNLEMMCQFEGPIVHHLWEHGIETWDEPALQLVSMNKDFICTPSDNGDEGSGKGAIFPQDPPPRYTRRDVTEVLNRSVSSQIPITAPDGDLPGPPFRSHVRLIDRNIPMILTPRQAYPAVDNSSLNTPQNIAWLSVVYFAQSTIFIQTPDLNAEPVVSTLINAVKRGVEVTIILCLGYNDLGEMLPMQGGHNEYIAANMKEQLSEEERKSLKILWYIGRDMTEPVHATKNFRTCHIKLMIVDDKIGIMGSGNQDTQSWFHSQETNIVVDSEEICKQWMKQLKSNQNSFEYGIGHENDGIWRDNTGGLEAKSIGHTTGITAWAKGINALISGKLWS